MPTPKNRLRGRRGWTDAHRRQLATGWCPFRWEGWSSDGLNLLHPSHRSFTTLASIPRDVLEEMHDAWAAMGGDVEAEYAGDHPGRRPWFVWLTQLLVDEPRRVVDPEHFDDEAEDDARLMRPHSTWEQDRGCESSASYLLRRGLLLPGELDRVRERESREHGSAKQRIEFQRTAYYKSPVGAHGLACAAFILGDDILTEEERDEATGELALLRSYETTDNP